MVVTREFKAIAQAGPLWRNVNGMVRWKQSDQARRTLWNRLRSCTPGGGWMQEAAVLDDIHVDFYHPASRVAVELDGGYHDRMSYLTTSSKTNRVVTVPAQPDLDARRDQRLAHVGIEVIRVRDYQTTQPEVLGHIIDRIRHRVRERSAGSPVPVI
jgi:very-short-patch-repair endonuclease